MINDSPLIGDDLFGEISEFKTNLPYLRYQYVAAKYSLFTVEYNILSYTNFRFFTGP